MFLSGRHLAIVHALYDRHRDLAEGDDEQRRQLTRMICEQARFEFGDSWGHKSADRTRPPSKDALAQKQPDGRLFAWDLFDGSTRAPMRNPESMDITGQHFIEVPPVAHLPAPEPAPVTVPGDLEIRLSELSEAIAAARRGVDAMESAERQIRAAILALGLPSGSVVET
jgi:hypothetical protein